MIGNDIVDLALARKESNWIRKGFLDKIFTKKEQVVIKAAVNPEIMVWNLWSRKEAAYKIYNRQTGIRGYIPLKLECVFDLDNSGIVMCNNVRYYTQTKITNEYVYTIAVAKREYFKLLTPIKPCEEIIKKNGIPSRLEEQTKMSRPVSISQHGRFTKCITI